LMGHNTRQTSAVWTSARYEQQSSPVITDESTLAGELAGKVHDTLSAWVLPEEASFWGAGSIWLLVVGQLSTLAGMLVSSGLFLWKSFLLLHLLVGSLSPGVVGQSEDLQQASCTNQPVCRARIGFTPSWAGRLLYTVGHKKHTKSSAATSVRCVGMCSN